MAVCGKCHREAPDGALFCSFCGGTIKPPTGSGEAADPLIGTTLSGKYFVHQLLGRGGMGDVYKATHLTLDRPVVIKLLRKSFLSDPSVVQRFHREARAASRLNHPNSISIIDFGQTDDGTLFMAMEYLAGRTLARVISEDWPLPEQRVVRIGAQVLAALAEAHAMGIIHRDLKPANVILETRRDEPDFAKVLDFGIAKLNEPGEGGGRLTQAGMVCGTPGYMSPEQVRGDELDPRSDLYAVGVILYEMLTGLLPFEADTPMGLVTKHLVESPPPMAARRTGISVTTELEALVMRALAKDKTLRPASADEMRAELLACPVSAEPPVVEEPPAAPQVTAVFDPAALPPPPPPRPVGVPAPPARPPTPASTVKPPAPRTTPPAPRTPSARPAPPRRTPATPAPARQTPRGAQAVRTPPPRRAVARPGDEEEGSEVAATPPSPARSRLPLVLGAGAAGLVIVALAIWGIVSPPESPRGAPDNAVQVATGQPAAPAPPTPTSTPTPAPTSTSTPTSTPTSTSTPLPLPTPAPAPAPTETPNPVRPPAAAPRKGIRLVRESLNSVPTPPPSSGDGVLSIDATPWALVAVDGREVGETPRELRLGAGTYRVKATHPQFGVREETVTIAAGKRRSLAVKFSP